MYDRDKAVEFAKAQLGKPYQWAGTGHPGLDCSGLVMLAVAAGHGPALPHNSGAQVSAKGVTQVPFSAAAKAKLRPGDIVFWYGTITQPTSVSHCGLYIGRHTVQKGDGQATYWDCIAAVDQAHGVLRHRMNWALRPCGFGYVDSEGEH